MSALRLKDNRGAIMVIGVFFACMMIGWMWMLVGLGDAMIWRDRSQEAADAVSYSSAAVQAQGMNLISFINILMLILAAVYLLLSFVYNIADFLHIILGSDKDKAACMQSSCGARKTDMEIVSALPYFEWLEPVADVWCDAANVVGALVNGNSNGAPTQFSVGGLLGSLETVMVDTMPVLSKFEDFVAYAFPWAGELVGVYTATTFTDWGHSRIGLPLSATLIPATFTPGKAGSFPAKKYKSCDSDECTNPTDCNAEDTGNCQPESDGGDKREGLPVDIPDKGFTALCDYAGAKVTSSASDAVKNLLGGGIMGSVGSVIVSTVLGALADAMSDDYCSADSNGLFGTLDDIIDFSAPPLTAIQGGGWKNKEKCPHNDWGGGGGGECGGPTACDSVWQMKIDGDNGSKNFWGNPTEAGGPHLVVDYAANGNDWMQVWGGVWGGNRTEQAEKKVAVASMDSQNGSGTWQSIIGGSTTETLFTFYLSQSEFYFDCEDKWDADECNKDSNASYNIAWRARLRRMHGLSWGSDILGYAWNGSLGSTFDDKVKDVIQGAMGSVFNDPIAQRLSTTAVNNGYTFIKGYAGDLVGSAFNPASAVPDFIH